MNVKGKTYTFSVPRKEKVIELINCKITPGNKSHLDENKPCLEKVYISVYRTYMFGFSVYKK